MSNYGVIIKDIKVPHAAYRSRSGLIIYSIPVDISIPDDLIGALKDTNLRYLGRFNKDNRFSVCVREDERNSYLISSPEHFMGLKLDDNSGKLYVPSKLPEKSLYLLNELTRVFAIRPAKHESVSMEDVKRAELVTDFGLSKRAVADIKEAVRRGHVRYESGIFQEVIDFLEEAVGNF